jgi:hypothetical protein
VPQQVRLHLLVGVDHRVDHVGAHRLLHPRGRRRHEAFHVEAVRIDEETHERHLVVRLVRYVRHHHDARARHVGVGLGAGGKIGGAPFAARGEDRQKR